PASRSPLLSLSLSPSCPIYPLHLPSFPTRRSSDLSFARLTLPRLTTSTFSTLGECRGQVFSTPIPLEVLRTVKVSRFPPPCLFRSEEHTSELQSRFDLVCRLLLEKKNYNRSHHERT